jgi:hypothetical protein
MYASDQRYRLPNRDGSGLVPPSVSPAAGHRVRRLLAVLGLGVYVVVGMSPNSHAVPSRTAGSVAAITSSGQEDLFGYDITLQGTTVVVGAPRDDTIAGSWAGSAYVGIISGTGASLQATLTHPNPSPIDNFGRSVSLDGDTLVVGAPRDNGDAGSAHVFVRSGSTWSLQATLTHPNPAPVDAFGRWTAISGDTVLVSAPLDDTTDGVDAGSVFVFVRSGTTWSRQAMLTSPIPRANTRFGKAIDIDGDTLVAGEPSRPGAGGTADVGAAHVFVRSGTTWSVQETLTHPTPSGQDRFGRWVSLDGGTTVVSAPGDDTPAGADSGSAHVFVRSGTDWSLQESLFPTGQAAGAQFGIRQTLQGDTAVIGAPKYDTSAGASAGRAFVFVRSGTAWSLQDTLTSPTPAATDLFGRAFGLDGPILVIGEPYDDNTSGRDAGAVHLFVREGTDWNARGSAINPNTTPP